MTTKADKARFDAFKRIGCIACRLWGFPATPADVHHLLSGGRRRGHQFTIPLCPWHHRGNPIPGLSSTLTEAAIGPSLANGSREFHAEFGSDETLLSLTNDLLSRH